MPKLKYYYDQESLSYLPVNSSWVSGLSGVVLFLLSSVLFGIFALFILLNTDASVFKRMNKANIPNKTEDKRNKTTPDKPETQLEFTGR